MAAGHRSAKQCIIALLGQPNSGKSTLFNTLTGSHQRVGNWPGKTVEKKEGFFVRENIRYTVVDLPGSYSLSAQSGEEEITRDYIASGSADVVCILVDASQLKRSLYLLADFAGIDVPSFCLLNMADIAENSGKTLDAEGLQQQLGIPVIPFVASDTKRYDTFFSALDQVMATPTKIKVDELEQQYEKTVGEAYVQALKKVPEKSSGQFSRMWLAAQAVSQTPKGSVSCAEARFAWIDALLEKTHYRAQMPDVPSQTGAGLSRLSRFDRLATSKRVGKPLSILIIILGLILSLVCAMPIMGIASSIPNLLSLPLTQVLQSIGCADFLIDYIVSGLLNVLYLTVSMTGFVFGITFVFGIIEDVGYMARISYLFDNTMAKLGLQGKAIMPFLISCGCTIGGVASTRVIDSWGQRILTIVLAWAVPCGATWAIIPTLAAAFFGWGAILVMLAILAFMLLFMFITANIFRPMLIPKEEQAGMVMELPPYHRPHWKNLLKSSFNRTKHIFIRALRVIFIVTTVFWIFAYSADGNASSSALYVFGQAIEPVTRIFGMGWQTFLAFVSSMLSKEAVLGVLGALYGSDPTTLFAASLKSSSSAANITEILAASIPPAEALAFMFAVTFNIPCVMALASTYQESHSLKWTVIIALYYIVMALLLSFVVYHVGLLIFA